MSETLNPPRKDRQIKRTQSIQVIPETLAARLVTMQALAALMLAARADPPLKPNQPNQRKAVPRTT